MSLQITNQPDTISVTIVIFTDKVNLFNTVVGTLLFLSNDYDRWVDNFKASDNYKDIRLDHITYTLQRKYAVYVSNINDRIFNA